MCGLMLLVEFRNLTNDQAASAWSFAASVQYALNLPPDVQYLCPRTLDTYRQLLVEDETAEGVFEEVHAALVKEVGGRIGRRRLDSTHVLSYMAKFGRLKLLAVTTKRFLTQLLRHHPEEYEALPDELRAHYGVAESWTFAFGNKNPVPREEAPGRAATVKTKKQTDPEEASSPATWTEVRRTEHESDECKKRYALRSGMEGVNEALDRTTGMKALRVRGKRAVHMAIYLTVTGWNIKCVATILRLRDRRHVSNARLKPKNKGSKDRKHPKMAVPAPEKPLSRRSPHRLRLRHRRFSPYHHLRP